jgi:hypothetical protein
VLNKPWTLDSFLAWEDRQEGKHEFDGQAIIPMTGGGIAYQRIVVQGAAGKQPQQCDRTGPGNAAAVRR